MAESMKGLKRTHRCAELSAANVGEKVTIMGWVQKNRNKGGLVFVDVRDRSGIIQVVFEEGKSEAALIEKAAKLRAEYVVAIVGTVAKRSGAVNDHLATGEIEVLPEELRILSESETPPFHIEENSKTKEEVRLKYRYLDLRRPDLQRNLMMRSKVATLTRQFLAEEGFLEIETPVLIKSTPEGARDYLVPSRIQQGQFYALPQSPQLFKQLLMCSGYDRYFQIAKCFRDEDLRADRQPEFTQIDMELSFVDVDDVIEVNERLLAKLFKEVLGVEVSLPIQRMTWQEAMDRFGSDKPDIRFGMKFADLTRLARTKDFAVFNSAEYIGGICVPGCASYTRKQLDELTDFVKRPQVGAKGLVYVKYNEDGSIKSSVDKFYTAEELKVWLDTCQAQPGDLLLILCGAKNKTLPQLCELRLEMGNRLGLRDKNVFKPLWIVDFPLLEWDEETQRFYAMHHPFTSPNPEDIDLMETRPGDVRANAYDMVINGVEVGGGSIRIHDTALQQRMFKCLGFTPEQAEKQFGFLLNAFKYGAPPHGGIAFGFDRLVSMFAGLDSIRDTIAFPKNNSGRDVMIDSPSEISAEQFKELGIKLNQ
mgnify:CR=1 FL=1